MSTKNIFISLFLLVTIQVSAQTAPVEGLRDNTPGVHALINARIVQSPGKVIEKGTVVIRDGLIDAVGANITPPADARIWDYSDKTVYPGFIESYLPVGLKQQGDDDSDEPDSEDYEGSETGAPDWNPHVHPQLRALDHFQPDEKQLETYRKLGFTAAVIVPDDGIFRGSGALISLSDIDANDMIIQDDVAQYLAFQRSANYRDATYPGSLMGCIALIRQTLLDAQWYQNAWQAYGINPADQMRPEKNDALKALQPLVNHQRLIVWETGNYFNVLRALKIANEFGMKPIIRGSGDEYVILDELKKANVPIILPLNFPQELPVETPEEALQVSLQELQHWDLDPENPKRLQDAGITFALTSSELKKTEDFHSRLMDAIERGLSEEAALAALTTTPAKLFGIQDKLGSIERGKMAHLTVTDGDLFDLRSITKEKIEVLDVWIDGNRFEVTKQPLVEIKGIWQAILNFGENSKWEGRLQVKGEPPNLRAELIRDDTKISVKEISLSWKRLKIIFPGDTLGYPGMIRLTATVVPKQINGSGRLPDGRNFNWSAKWISPLPEKNEKPSPKPQQKSIAEIVYPFGAFGREQLPEQPKSILIKNATIWTSGPQGILENADMLIISGKIGKVGKGLTAPKDALIIDAQRKHVTAGLIDCHSHSGISGGVNEGTQAVTAEVRIQDVINSYSIDFYRELAGGLTEANLLHGSANPIGGQNAVVKLRWGMLPDAIRFAAAPPGIKFALGENVKQSNWGDEFTNRYPQTRMGVEQIMRDRFKAALDYEEEWNVYNAKKNKKGIIPPRRDLELETLLEILHGDRMIHCHSYRQDEILMLIRLADEFGFTIGTFQHVLEGYKIADAIAEHGAGASCFSDWWAYKFEVYDAIPYNGPLMHDVGVVVSYNSDSDELARRLNTEAAKAVKYGGLSEEEALDFVTINPAIQLGIDERVGSLEPGKDADFVIWSGNPLSTYTICEQTWIEGRKYFDRQEDLQMRTEIEKQRNALIQKYLTSQKIEGKSSKAASKTMEILNDFSWRFEDEDYSCSNRW